MKKKRPLTPIRNCGGYGISSDPGSVSWNIPRFDTGSHRAKPNPLNDASVDACGGMMEVQAATMVPLEAKSKLQERTVQDVAKLTRARSRPWEKEDGP